VTTVVVTGAGGPAGVAVLRALAQSGHTPVAADADADAAGLRMVADRAVLPAASDPRFGAAVLALVDATRPAVLVTTVSEELAALSELRPELTARGVAAWLPPMAAVEVSLDKWKFARVLHDDGIPTPPTALGGPSTLEGPWVVKPRFGRGSRDVHVVDEPEAVAWACRRTPEPIVQTRAEGREFTADVLVDRDGRVAACVPRWRLETKAGISTRGETFVSPAVNALVARTVATVGLDGILNLQGFVDGGAVTVVEVNPRFSGGLPLSLAAGADLVGQYVRGALGLPIQSARLEHRPGVRMIRSFREHFESS
jgi:carbamoyl-phosphate synthase large subunit